MWVLGAMVPPAASQRAAAMGSLVWYLISGAGVVAFGRRAADGSAVVDIVIENDSSISKLHASLEVEAQSAAPGRAPALLLTGRRGRIKATHRAPCAAPAHPTLAPPLPTPEQTRADSACS